MIKALLIDLEGTLLKSEEDSFLPSYLQLVGDSLSDLAPADQIVGVLVRSTQEMVSNNDPTRTMKDVFDSFFYPHLKTSEEELRPWIDRFYREEYPVLQPLSQPSEGAATLVEHASNKDLEIAIATSPLYPMTAVDQRLQWAGFDPPSEVFSLIASYEIFHFSKPHPAYFAELLGMLGYGFEEVAMIGNDFEGDLIPALKLGISSYLVGEEEFEMVPSGELSDVWSWVQNGAINQHTPEANLRSTTILSQLRGYHSALLAQVSGMDAALWDLRPEPDSWAPIEIVSHLKDVEREVNQPRVEKILEQEVPFLQAMNPDEWAVERDYLKNNPNRTIADMTSARLETLETLEQRRASEWQRKANHSIFGPTNLAEVLHVAMQHELLHLGQLRSTLSQLRTPG